MPSSPLSFTAVVRRHDRHHCNIECAGAEGRGGAEVNREGRERVNSTINTLEIQRVENKQGMGGRGRIERQEAVPDGGGPSAV